MMNDEIKNETLLSNRQSNAVIDMIVDIVEDSAVRYTDSNMSIIVIEKLTAYYYSTDLFNFFTLQSLQLRTEEILQDTLLRDFIFNLTEKVSLLLSLNNISYDALIDNIVVSYCRGKIDPSSDNYCLINKETIQTLYVNPTALKFTLKDNFWLVVFYLTVTFFNQTVLFKAQTK